MSEEITCPDCRSNNIYSFKNGCSVYPEMPMPVYGCNNCQLIFSLNDNNKMSYSVSKYNGVGRD